MRAGAGTAGCLDTNQKYPFIDVKLNRLTSDNLYPRVIAETRSGKFLSDVLQNNALGMYFLKKGKFLAHYLSPEERFYASDFKDQGYWTTRNRAPVDWTTLGPTLVVPSGMGWRLAPPTPTRRDYSSILFSPEKDNGWSWRRNETQPAPTSPRSRVP